MKEQLKNQTLQIETLSTLKNVTILILTLFITSSFIGLSKTDQDRSKQTWDSIRVGQEANWKECTCDIIGTIDNKSQAKLALTSININGSKSRNLKPGESFDFRNDETGFTCNVYLKRIIDKKTVSITITAIR